MRWSNDDIQFLIDNYNKMGVHDMAKNLKLVILYIRNA